MADKFKKISPCLLNFIGCSLVVGMIFYAIGVLILLDKPIETPSADYSAPEITLLGDSHITIYTGDSYDDPGAISDTTVFASGQVDATRPGDYLVSYVTADSAGNIATASRVVTVLSRNTGVIYLTFDDGPSAYTAELLDVLAKYNVKATFFVTNAGSDEMIAREYNEGHAIGLHSCTHDYSYIYTSVDNFFSDLYCVQNRVKKYHRLYFISHALPRRQFQSSK